MVATDAVAAVSGAAVGPGAVAVWGAAAEEGVQAEPEVFVAEGELLVAERERVGAAAGMQDVGGGPVRKPENRYLLSTIKWPTSCLSIL